LHPESAWALMRCGNSSLPDVAQDAFIWDLPLLTKPISQADRTSRNTEKG
jgi:hypothetical protein